MKSVRLKVIENWVVILIRVVYSIAKSKVAENLVVVKNCQVYHTYM